jgi:hypothetical protein
MMDRMVCIAVEFHNYIEAMGDAVVGMLTGWARGALVVVSSFDLVRTMHFEPVDS